MSDTTLSANVGGYVRSASGTTPAEATDRKFWFGLSAAIMEKLADPWAETTKAYNATRQQHYFSAEFLMGRALLNNLTNLEIEAEVANAVRDNGHELSDILEAENDAALGNGGLGRLAACFLDSCATQDLPVTGYGLLYRYGLFKQSFRDGFQHEEPDAWREDGYPFTIRRDNEQRIVRFDDMTVRATPYDMPITGYGTANVGTLRLWNSEPLEEFDYDAFNSQRFTDAIVERERVMDICRVLYPNDTTYAGKVLRVRQQYFFVSASLQQMIDNYIAHHGSDLRNFAQYNCIQLNDTHPVLAIPELMRLLLDEHNLSWDDAWKVTSQTFAYTNHTVLAEALEQWNVSIFQQLFYRVWEITQEIDRRFREEMAAAGFDQAKINYMAPVQDGNVHMAWIACYAAYSINGVAALHTDIIKAETLKDWHDVWPEKFNNKTNGVTPRRWLKMCNPRLADLLTRLSGSNTWVTDLDDLKRLRDYANNDDIMRELMQIKANNKKDFAAWIKDRQDIDIDPNSIFDTQIKRLHEYKRQLMNALYVLDLYFRIKEDGEQNIPPRTFIFGAKAAPGYIRAKAIIKLINVIADLINNDPVVSQTLRVVFVENYNVSPAEHIIPASDISEQISTAGKEASGTSNMKFMMNGALTLGTMDGANVEIVDSVGMDNAYIFGARNEELPELKAHYNPYALYETVPGLKRVLDALSNGLLDDNGSGWFHDLRASLLDGGGWETPDVYYVLGDFASYRETRDRMAADYYADPLHWARMCWVNICESGRFSSDRTINDYAQEVWKLEPTPIR
ncbi:glycogen phosphorylase [Corynebacterium kutscheri]|uniref:Alpha-1,4 glucan phosphorylase n=1 Tax=Corynebacterium kutscheri TaxID=35755 RepID=A0A0F6R2A3_9CORY|nr:glycogen/starch/alpha-glucan phosphorylase [Corynebacterium kutscheri]AKE41508.1 glycogen/starch/alpha-glucan phosphorylase [Corynebacterium kutscheri]VEH08786.1 glycogen phosphorylase [Corynebacterium kutscheri]VEH09832.1 glycogen phosphorylase [Corynebacterium kutscheri]VEH79915.1 glycogen phosphorylase [Corynebacterium kutscheri]